MRLEALDRTDESRIAEEMPDNVISMPQPRGVVVRTAGRSTC